MTRALGRRLGPYAIAALLGPGGGGEVYRAHGIHRGPEVAVKVIPFELTRDPQRIRRSEPAARAAAPPS